MRLLDSQTTSGNSETISGEEGVYKVKGPISSTFAVEGVLDGATVTLEWQKAVGATWNAFHDDAGEFTAVGIKVLWIPTNQDEPIRIRARLTGAGGSTNVTVHAD